MVAAISALAAVGMLTSACASNSTATAASGNSSQPFLYYAVIGLSGAEAGYSVAFKTALQAAANTINSDGGLLGRKINLVIANDQSSPTQAVSLLQAQLQKQKPDAVWAGSSDSETLPMAQLLMPDKVMTFSPGSSTQLGNAKAFPYYFSASVRTADIADYLASYLVSKGYKTVGQLSGTDAFGQNAAQQYKAAFEKAGLKVVAASYDPSAVQMVAPLESIKAGNPDVVVFTDFVAPQYVLESRLTAGMSNIPFLGDLSSTAVDISPSVNSNEEKNLLLTYYKEDIKGGPEAAQEPPGVTGLLKALNDLGGKAPLPLSTYSIAYDSLLAYANAVEAVGSTDVDKVRAAMEENLGHKFPLSLADDPGWTTEDHIANPRDAFTTMPVAPLSNGQYDLGQ